MLTAAIPTVVLAHAAHQEAEGLGVPLLFLVLLAVLPVLLGATLLRRSVDPVTSVVCLFSAGAGAIHAMVTPEHFREDLRFGVFFLVVTALQFAWVVLVLRQASAATWVVGVGGNLAVVAIWAASRTTGLPIGPHPWAMEPMGLLDLACGAYEVAIVAGCLWLARTCPPDRIGTFGRPSSGRSALVRIAPGCDARSETWTSVLEEEPVKRLFWNAIAIFGPANRKARPRRADRKPATSAK